MESKRSIYFEQMVLMAVGICFVAMIMEPYFSQAYEKSRSGQLIDGLEKMRICVEIYKAKHGQMPPTDSAAGFEKAMTSFNFDEEIYLRKIPVNPFNGLKTVRFDGKAAGENKAGWRIERVAGSVQADDSVTNASL
jgi:hypothetical protein